MAIVEPADFSTAAEIAVNGGITTMSRSRTSRTSGRNASKKSRVAARFLYIFQLPAITRRRLGAVIIWFCSRLVRQRSPAREFGAAKKFQGRAAAGRNVRDRASHSGLLHSRNGIA